MQTTQKSPLRIFAFSLLLTLAGLLGVLLGMGPGAVLIMLILIAVEITFSFDNAVINAQILSRLSPFWQKMFLTVGILIAVLGMRIVFPISIVSLTAHLGWTNVMHLALYHPDEYAQKLENAHVSIAAFGGAFLLMLTLYFFFDDKREVLWLKRIERRMQRIATKWMPAAVALLILLLIAALPMNHHKSETVFAGLLGVAVYGLLRAATVLMEKLYHTKASGRGTQHGVAALVSFLYLEVLDASFSFDGVIGAFAITNKVILIAVGLGIGALWVRSLTIFIVERRMLVAYRYLEHGAHYAILVLALILLVSILVHVPDMIAGATGITFILSSLYASRKALDGEKV